MAMFESALYKLSSIELKDYKDLLTYLPVFRECTATLEEMGSPSPHKQQVAFYKRGLPRYLQHHMFTLSQYDVRNNREVNLDSITIGLMNFHR
ncbi:hypothetical protein N7G274_002168 [Stereocaulon virgatum]|uniref:Uncharacterized protein n=1 Tax=Stereocaulon virgatum TaxID=373712 RepID=A0ABR4AM16_9LECA